MVPATASLPGGPRPSGGAVAGAARVVEGLRVFPERMRANLELDGGTIMAEAAMMAVGEVLGRAEAHAVVYEASSLARAESVSLTAALRKTLAHDVLAALPGNRLEALKGNRQGQYSIRINDQWRICFQWPEKSSVPTNVEIVDYH